MKSLILILSVVGLLIGCENDDTPQNFPTNTGSLSATVEGEATVYTGTTVNTCYGGCLISEVNTMFNLNVEDGSGNFFGFVVINAGVGTFDLGTANSTDEDLACSSFAYYSDPADSSEDEDEFYTSFEDYGGSGTVVFTEFDTETNLASGSFEFLVRTQAINGEEISVANGTFTDLAIQPLQNCTVTLF